MNAFCSVGWTFTLWIQGDCMTIKQSFIDTYFTFRKLLRIATHLHLLVFALGSLPVFNIFFSSLLCIKLIRYPSHFPVLSYCAGVSCSVYSSNLSFFALPSSLALLQRLPGSFQFSRNFDLPSRFCYILQTKEEVRTAALLNVQTSCNKVCINNASWNTDFFS